MSKGKIALCFLITADVSNPQVWEHWWENKEDKISVYSHYSRGKGKGKSVTIPWLKENRVPPVPTRWGDISLVFAEGQLYKEAIKDPRNKYFALLSGTCIPVRTFSYFYRRVTNSKKGMLSWEKLDPYKITDEDYIPFIKSAKCTKTLISEKIVGAPLYTAHQWKILSRSNVRDFLSMLQDKVFLKVFKRCIKVVPDNLAPDELMFANYLKNKYGCLGKVVRSAGITYVEFPKDAVHPKQLFNITNRLRQEICDIGALFARKFSRRNDKLIEQLPVKCNGR